MIAPGLRPALNDDVGERPTGVGARTRPVTRGEMNGEKGIDSQPTNAKAARKNERDLFTAVS